MKLHSILILYFIKISCFGTTYADRGKHEFAHCEAILKRIIVQVDIHIREEIAWGTQVLHEIWRISRPIKTLLGSHSKYVMI